MINSGKFPGMAVNILNSDIEVSEFEVQPHYNVHFQTKTLRKYMTIFILLHLCVKYCHYCSSARMDLTFNTL